MSNNYSKYIAALLLFCSLGVKAQVVDTTASTHSETQANVEKEPITLFNTFGKRHSVINNFDYAVILPNTGYKQSSSNFFSFFENEVDQATIGIGQTANSKIFDSQFEEANKCAYRINGVDATLYKSTDDKGRCKQTLKIDTHTPIFVTAACKSDDTININKLERCLLSIVYSGPEQKDKNTYTTSLFSISNGGYKLENSGLHLSIFTKSGDFAEERANNIKDIFQLGTFRCEVKKKQQKKEALKLIEGLLEKGSKIVSNKTCAINGRNGFEYNIETTDEEGKLVEKSYATVIYTADRAFLFYASANKDIDKNIAIFKTIAQTLKIK
ncbi:MAG: hypothetical protein MJZ02_01535 [Paludibacteraceae bacterium]|nr:hypothetical protein [Paludibacteraceae bacterium]